MMRNLNLFQKSVIR